MYNLLLHLRSVIESNCLHTCLISIDINFGNGAFSSLSETHNSGFDSETPLPHSSPEKMNIYNTACPLIS